MPDDNPYQPPKETPTELPLPLEIPDFRIRWWGILAIGVAGGFVVAMCLQLFSNDTHPLFVLGLPAVALFVSISALLISLTPASPNPGGKLLLASIITIPAYVLYIPICTFTSVFTQPVFGSVGYGPSFTGLVFASVLAFVLILFGCATSVRQRLRSKSMKHRIDPDDGES